MIKALVDLADEVGVPAHRDAMFAGERINVTENRSVLHTALRRPKGDVLMVDGVNVVEQVHEVLDAMYAFADRVRSGEWVGVTGKKITTVINIGIGGSDLGPVMVYEALKPYVTPGLEARFVSNIDPTDVVEKTKGVDPETVLFIVASKTFTTLETLTNARLARELRESPAIAGLRKPDGSLDMERYRQLAAAQGLTPEGFESRVRADLTTRQVVSGVSASALDAKALADLAMKLYLERREVQLTRYAARDWAAQVKPTEAEIEAYYKEHPREFQSPESADVEYLVLDVDALRKGVTVSEADLKTYYEQNQARLAGQEQRRASHILLTVAKGAPAEEKAKDE
mgnify:CR=1 FL=1